MTLRPPPDSPDTPIYAKLVEEQGDPMDAFPYIVFALIGFTGETAEC